MSPEHYLEQLRQRLAKVAMAEDAAPMQAYMKSGMPYHGVKKPARVAALKGFFKENPIPLGKLERYARHFWDNAAFREERYATLDLLKRREYKTHLVPSALPMYEAMLVSGAWWDLVDPIASPPVGIIFDEHREEVGPTLRSWTRDSDMWRRRTAIICQLRLKERTDLALLEEAIVAAIDEKEFFLRKAIGWALRQHARTDADWVRDFVKRHEGRLSGLSYREATKHL